MSGGLSARESALVRVSATLAGRREGRLRAALEEALAAGAGRGSVEEVILQAYLFLGYPASLGAFALWREVSGAGADPPTGGDWEDWRQRGPEVCGRVYGAQYGELRANIRRLHADLADWMVVEGYGKVLGRPGLELRVRELCIAALLAVLDAPVQLRSHLRGALNTGASLAEVEDTMRIALAEAEEAAGQNARQTWAVVRGRWEALAGAVRE